MISSGEGSETGERGSVTYVYVYVTYVYVYVTYVYVYGHMCMCMDMRMCVCEGVCGSEACGGGGGESGISEAKRFCSATGVR